uniref:Ubiquitin carboxyl-terminal hydrolase 7 n=1 Tax=Panagrolaimus sp. JU765 TaxID=591449 RepID=A0AC34QJV6_9BILA
MSSNFPRPTIDSPEEIVNVKTDVKYNNAKSQKVLPRKRTAKIEVDDDLGIEDDSGDDMTDGNQYIVQKNLNPYTWRQQPKNPIYHAEAPRVPDDDDIDIDVDNDIEIDRIMPNNGIIMTSDEEVEEQEDDDDNMYGGDVSLTDDEVVAPNLLLSDVPPNESVMLLGECPTAVQYNTKEYMEDLISNVPSVEITFKLKGVRQFRRMPENTHFYSNYGVVRGIPFRIMILNRDLGPIRTNTPGYVGNRHIGFFVQCNPDIKFKWNMRAIVYLKMLSQDPRRDDYTRRIVHTFHPGENDWGYAQYYSCDNFDDSNNPYLRDDAVTFKVVIMPDPPKFPLYCNPTFNQFFADRCGLKNLGSTCYFNSLLQMLFSIRKLRKLIYNFDSTGDSEHAKFMLELQLTFYKMQYSDHPVDPSNLGKLLWNDTFTQEDVHDMFMKLIDRVETAMRPDESVKELFQSRLLRFIKCLNVNHTKNLSTEELNCILLCVRQGNKIFGCLRESLINYTAGSRLEGDNCYNSEEYGLQVADMCSRFVKFPPILVVTLQRSTYDNFAVKLNDRFEYDSQMDLEEFLDEKLPIKNAKYTLNSVLVHYGESGCGHYVSYVDTNMNHTDSRWVKCDDELVYRVTNGEAITNNYGITEGAKEQDSGTAYVITYIRNDVIEEMMCPVTEQDMSPAVREIITKRFDEEEQNYKEKMESTFCQTLFVLNDEILKDLKYSRFDLFDPKDEELTKGLPRIILPKDMFIGDLYKNLRTHCDFLTDRNFRVYLFRHSEIPYTSADMKVPFKGGLRPCYMMVPEVLHQAQMLGDGYVQGAVYVREIEEPLMLEDCQENPMEMLIFIKVFEQGELYFAGSMMIIPNDVVSDLFPEFRRACGFSNDQPIRVYTEVSPFDVRELEEDDVANSHNGFNGDGSIIVVEKVEEQDDEEKRFTTHWDKLSRAVTLNIEKDNDLFPLNTIKQHPLTHTIECLVDSEVSQIAEDICDNGPPGIDKNHILIWKASPGFDRPSYNFWDQMNASTVGDLIGTKSDAFDGRERYIFDLQYTILNFPLEQNVIYYQKPVFYIDSRFKLTQYDVLFGSKWTVGQALENAPKSLGLKPSDKNSGKLRLVAAFRCGQERSYMGTITRAFKVIDFAMPCSNLMKLINEMNCTLRMEEIPLDQLNLEEGEHLIPVIHFETSITTIFGVSFFIKIKVGQKFSEIKAKLREILNVKSEDFCMYNFFIFEGAKSRGPLEDTTVMREEWVNSESHYVERPVIAIQHPPTPECPKISVLL